MSRSKADTLLLLASCALVLLPHAWHLPWWATPLCAALLIWRGWVTFRGNRMPPRWLLLPIAVGAMLGVYLTHRTLLGREAGVTMLAILLALKLLEMHAKRDLFVVLFLSFFLILASFFYSQSIGTAVMTIVAVIAILTTQISFQYTGLVPPLRQRLRLGFIVVALAVPLTLLLFVLFPRIQGPLWGLPGDAHAGRTGLSDTMSPGNISNLAQSEEIAFRVKFSGAAPPQSQLYWRGVVLANYDGRNWSALRSPLGRNTQIKLNLRGEPVDYQVTLEPHGRRWLFALEVPRILPQLANNAAFMSDELQMLSSRPINARVRYDVSSHVDFDMQPELTDQLLEPWLRLPAGFHPRTRELAAQLRGQYRSAPEIVNAALRNFREQEFIYTLQPPLLGRDAVDDFLFTTRAGFCEHYSAAFVVMMRAAGIPSRVVTGYQGGEINPSDGYMTVRQSDAHAWAEVWLEGRGWTRVDPTAAVAPDRIRRNLSSVIPRSVFGGLVTLDASGSTWISSLLRLRNSWEAVNNAWNQRVLNYTPEKQRDLLESLGFDNVDWRTLTGLLVVLGAIVAAIMTLPLMLNRRRRDPLSALYDALCRKMARRGLPRELHEGPRDYCARLTGSESPLTAGEKTAISRFLQCYELLRYGSTQYTSPNSVATLKSLLNECR
jgi:transglutaminase-like putative cysteine protease